MYFSTFKIKNFIILILLFFSLTLTANWEQEKLKIDFLLNKVVHLDGIFVRNGTKHKPKKSIKHLKMKLENAMDSWFSPNEN